jgi:hypothetical protein
MRPDIGPFLPTVLRVFGMVALAVVIVLLVIGSLIFHCKSDIGWYSHAGL